MKAMIMAAGVGSRLMPMTVDIPKPMIPMGNRPLMENTVNLLEQNGFTELIANLHYQADVIGSHFGDGSKFGVSMNYSREDELKGTAGGVKNCEWFLDDTFVIVSGDALTDVNLSELVEAHRNKGALATIALKQVEDVQHFGVVITDESGKIQKFQEKPRPEEALSKMANTGIYVFEPEIFKYIPARQFYDFGKQVFPCLVKADAPFYGVEVDSYWCDVGNINTYRQAHSDILAERVQYQSNGTIIDGSGQSKVLLEERVEIGDNVRFTGNVVIGAGCKIADNVIIDSSVIWNDSIIDNNVLIENAVIGANCHIGSYVEIHGGTAVASGCELEDRIVIPENQKVFASSGGSLKLEQG